MMFQGKDISEDAAARAHVLGMVRHAFSPERPLFVGHNVMRECLLDPDLCGFVAEGHIVETPMLR